MKGKKQSAGTNPWTGCAFVSQMPAGLSYYTGPNKGAVHW